MNSLLSDCWEHDVVLSVVGGNVKADYKKDSFLDELRLKIKENKPLLIERLRQKEVLKSNNWIVGCFEVIYECHFRCARIFILNVRKNNYFRCGGVLKKQR
jgi:predicted RNA-binding protein